MFHGSGDMLKLCSEQGLKEVGDDSGDTPRTSSLLSGEAGLSGDSEGSARSDLLCIISSGVLRNL